MAGDQSTSTELWNTIASEVARSTASRKRGVNYSEDFAVDKVCATLDKLRQMHEETMAQHDNARSGSVEEAVGLRAGLAMDEQRVKLQQRKMEEAQQQVRDAVTRRRDLLRELEAVEIARKQLGDEQAKQWRESASSSRLRLANLRAKEQEAAQLEEALSRPHDAFSTDASYERVRLESELRSAKAEAASSARDTEALVAERMHLERQMATKQELKLEGLRLAQEVRTLGDTRNTHSNTGQASPAVSDDKDLVRDDLMRIASRASDNVRSLREGMVGFNSGHGQGQGQREISTHASDGSASASFLSSGLGLNVDTRTTPASNLFMSSTGSRHISTAGASPSSPIASNSGNPALASRPQQLSGTIPVASMSTSAASFTSSASWKPAPYGASGFSTGGSLRVPLSSDNGLYTQNGTFDFGGSLRVPGTDAHSNIRSRTLDLPSYTSTTTLQMRASGLESFDTASRTRSSLESSSYVLDEAHRVLERMERLTSMKRAATAKGYTYG
eukprot:TRINITY_DN37067_c0_g1_i2.p1 TRINITY_DN37067_c0_g1~~TRINITY_DN37067_c0_g1_i2.p1  ORF type:complete len:503 (+),score=75.16 TRINITY_DN37067_c0_g1_i2:44-1552(+)